MTTILVVNPDAGFLLRLTAMLSPHAGELSLKIVSNRQEAQGAVQTSSFQQLITSLKIPGVHDGYRFLSQVANKVIAGKNITVLVDQDTDKVRADMAFFGLENIHVPGDIEAIFQAVRQTAGLGAAATHIVTFPISLANEGEMVRIHSSSHDSRIEEQLISMGININDEIMVVKKQPGGALMVQKNGNRFALGVGMAHKVHVLKV